jgi:hypothetical protein
MWPDDLLDEVQRTVVLIVRPSNCKEVLIEN